MYACPAGVPARSLRSAASDAESGRSPHSGITSPSWNCSVMLLSFLRCLKADNPERARRLIAALYSHVVILGIGLIRARGLYRVDIHIPPVAENFGKFLVTKEIRPVFSGRHVVGKEHMLHRLIRKVRGKAYGD